jgi:hypothetical protein
MVQLTLISALVANLTAAGAAGTVEAAVNCIAAGVPRGCVAVSDVGVNRGGPVNRAGVRRTLGCGSPHRSPVRTQFAISRMVRGSNTLLAMNERPAPGL